MLDDKMFTFSCRAFDENTVLRHRSVHQDYQGKSNPHFQIREKIDAIIFEYSIDAVQLSPVHLVDDVAVVDCS